MYYYDHMGFFGGFIMIIILLLFFLLLFWLVKQNNQIPKGNDPLVIAKERYARGEITKEEFEQLKKDLL